jgi:hypothetical protein
MTFNASILNSMSFSRMTLSMTTFNIMLFNLTTLYIMSLSRMSLSFTKLNIMSYFKMALK